MSDPAVCIYCGRTRDNGHTPECAQTTGVYPVTDAEVEAEIVCAECSEDLEDFYTVIDDGIVCLGCAVKELWL